MGEKFCILGWDRKAGEYQGKPFNNTVFYVEPKARKAACGIVTEQVKVKSTIVADCGVVVDESVLGKVLVVAYDKYGKPTAIMIVDE